ncbi:helix-turn-helix transcriptional regulator [Sphaerisporangium dianthi]|uniref:LuxR C-terminal-related transcriptional regulator n=1 Tax=Sphaerisporangium dianthi TaxID=1436120 RepID=A0ABV9CQH7_9ACTN
MDPSPGASWAGTGLTPLAGQVLEYLVGHPESDETAVAAAVGATAEDTGRALTSLETHLLAVRIEADVPAPHAKADVATTHAKADVLAGHAKADVLAGRVRADVPTVRVAGRTVRWRANPPHSSMGSLLARRRQELARAELHMERLHEIYRASAHRYVDSDLFEVLETPAEVATRYAHLLASSRHEILHLAKPPYVTSAGTATRADAGPGGAAGLVWNEGVELRSVYDSDGFTDAVSLETALRGSAMGGELRLCTDVPMKLAVFDRTTAIMPLGKDDPAAGSLVVHSPPLLEVLTALFESVWRRAVPVSLGAEPGPAAVPGRGPDDGPDERTREILILLSAGMKDEAVARALGLSRRTVQKHISDAAKTLGARTRFQIALLARDRGWLQPSEQNAPPSPQTG